jgi:hypothetical protein
MPTSGRAAAVAEAPLVAVLALLLARTPAAVAAVPGLRLLDGPLGDSLLLFGVLVGAARWRRNGERALAAFVGLPAGLVIALPALAYGLIGWHYAGRLQASGDEPHYLLMAQSLWQERDLDLRDNYAREDFLDYTPGPLAPHYAAPRADGRPYPAHSPGLPLLLAPVYAAGGRRACLLLMALLAALAAREAFLLARLLGSGARGSALAWAVAAGPPLAWYSFHVYTEIPSALLLAFSARVLLSSPGPGAAVAAALAAAALPWLHVKMALAAAAIGVVALLRLRGRARLAFVAVAGLAGLAFAAYYESVFGHPTPFAIYGGVPRDVVGASPGAALVGLVLDRSFGLWPHAPAFLLALAFLPLLRRAAPGAAATLLALALAVVIPALGWRMWWGGQCPPARFLVPIVPLLAALVGLHATLERRGLARWRSGLVLASYALAAFAVARPEDRLLLNRADRPTRLWDALAGEGGTSLGRYLPSMVSASAEEWRVAGVWLAGIALFLGLHAAARRSDRMNAAFGGLSLPLLVLLAATALIDMWARSP